jgi:hypothetical protein
VSATRGAGGAGCAAAADVSSSPHPDGSRLVTFLPTSSPNSAGGSTAMAAMVGTAGRLVPSGNEEGVMGDNRISVSTHVRVGGVVVRRSRAGEVRATRGDCGAGFRLQEKKGEEKRGEEKES